MEGHMLRAAIALLISVAASSAQQPRFEVASIRPSADPSSSNAGSHTGKGRVNMTNVTLKRCIMGAYGVGPNLIVGGPDWLDVDRFVIVAKAEEPVGDERLMIMLRSLLAERFKLAIHRETRTAPVYILEVAKNGPKLEKSEDGESKTNSGYGQLEARKTTMTGFAQRLSRQMDLPVVNETGLDGAFNLKLELTPDRGKPEADPGPSIFTAIQQQLGLRLRPGKAALEFLVVDHAEKPSEN
jgi:uncharacterized protein (TIGR03435 family)